MYDRETASMTSQHYDHLNKALTVTMSVNMPMEMGGMSQGPHLFALWAINAAERGKSNLLQG